MRATLTLVLIALVAFAAIAVLPAPLGLVSLARALVFVVGAACLVAVVPALVASVRRGSGAQLRVSGGPVVRG